MPDGLSSTIGKDRDSEQEGLASLFSPEFNRRTHHRRMECVHLFALQHEKKRDSDAHEIANFNNRYIRHCILGQFLLLKSSSSGRVGIWQVLK